MCMHEKCALIHLAFFSTVTKYIISQNVLPLVINFATTAPSNTTVYSPQVTLTFTVITITAAIHFVVVVATTTTAFTVATL